jgi:putative (di)nucleoside polyphosphate hydrolase
MTDFEKLPYRPCVGMMVLNREGRAFIGRRLEGPEHVDDRHAWQMPQGGVDEGEDLYEAALRELHEETNISSVERIGEIKDWLIYDIPRSLVGQAWKGKYRGQKQKWYAFRFTGKDSEIDVEHPPAASTSRIRGMALRSLEEASRPRRSFQARGL